MGLWFQRIPDEDQAADSTFPDSCSDLLVTPEQHAEEAVNVQADIDAQQLPGSAGRKQPMTSEGVPFVLCPLSSVVIQDVMYHQRVPLVLDG